MTSGPMWAKKPAAERAPTGRPVNLLVRESVEYRLAGTLNNMTTTTETVLSTPIVRKPAEENGEKEVEAPTWLGRLAGRFGVVSDRKRPA